MELCEVKAAFDALENNDFVFTDGFSKPHSYRGYYDQVAFEPAKFVSLPEIKISLNAALHDAFVAWKGGEYEYDEHTLVNLSFPGMCNNDAAESFEKLVSIMLNEYNDADHTSAQKKVRKTKAQKQAEAAIARRNEQQKEWEEFCKDYPNRFAALLFDYFNFGLTAHNLSVVKVENGYEFYSGTIWNRVGFVLTPIPPKEYSWEYMQSLREAESPIEEERERIKESMRKQQLRETALSKLTDEEKEALGYN